MAAILSYLSLRPPTKGPLFVFQDSTPLTRANLVKHLRGALSQAGINAGHYAGHSFIIGAATAAAQARYSDSFIQSLCRWKSAAFISYIRTPPSDLTSVARSLVATHTHFISYIRTSPSDLASVAGSSTHSLVTKFFSAHPFTLPPSRHPPHGVNISVNNNQSW